MNDIQERVRDAIDQLINDLTDGLGDTSAKVAGEYGIKHEVLVARFERAHGPITSWEAPTITKVDDMTLAMKAADALAKKFVSIDAAVFGKMFMFQGERYIAVVRSASHPKFFLRAVRVRDGHTWGFNRAVYQKSLAPLLAD